MCFCVAVSQSISPRQFTAVIVIGDMTNDSRTKYINTQELHGGCTHPRLLAPSIIDAILMFRNDSSRYHTPIPTTYSVALYGKQEAAVLRY